MTENTKWYFLSVSLLHFLWQFHINMKQIRVFLSAYIPTMSWSVFVLLFYLLRNLISFQWQIIKTPGGFFLNKTMKRFIPATEKESESCLIWKTNLCLIWSFMFHHNRKYNTDFTHSARWLKYCKDFSVNHKNTFLKHVSLTGHDWTPVKTSWMKIKIKRRRFSPHRSDVCGVNSLRLNNDSRLIVFAQLAVSLLNKRPLYSPSERRNIWTRSRWTEHKVFLFLPEEKNIHHTFWRHDHTATHDSCFLFLKILWN